jgi:hypothetical protein
MIFMSFGLRGAPRGCGAPGVRPGREGCVDLPPPPGRAWRPARALSRGRIIRSLARDGGAMRPTSLGVAPDRDAALASWMCWPMRVVRPASTRAPGARGLGA